MKSKFNKPALKADLAKALANSKEGQQVQLDSVIWKAYDLAFSAHEGQFREARASAKSAVPYITHPVGVAKTAVEYWKSGELSDGFETVVSVCLLHDVLEDTSVEFATLEENFGRRIAFLCEALTKPPRIEWETRAERNEAATKKIVAAGSTAVFVKACDALHNIGRPTAMPINLLKKTIEKVSGPYNRLIANQPFEMRISMAFSNALVQARKTLSSVTEIEDGVPSHSLEVLLEYISDRTNSKVFEEHDILALFLALPGIKGAFIGFKEQIASNFSSLCGELPEINFSVAKSSRANPMEWPIGERDTSERTDLTIITCPFLNTFVANDNRQFFILFDKLSCPNWFRPKTVSMVLELLTQRLVAQLRDRSLETASLISFHKLDFDIREAIRLSLDATDIIGLVELVRYAEDVVAHILVELKSAGFVANRSRGIETFDHRVKDLSSALQKMRSRSISNIGALDDFIGFRFVLLSKTDCRNLAEQLAIFLENLSDRNPNYMFISENDFQFTVIRSTHGYSAIHIGFKVRSGGDRKLTVGCEVQIRTIAEDAIARISHELTYKNSSMSKSERKKMEKFLQKTRDEIDSVVEAST